jgi:SAM-dependent methyltransferase/ribosomal protein S18 acetylase RimI-like enzyme
MIEVRPARSEDAAAIAAVHVQSHHETYRPLLGDGYAGPTLEERIALWTRWLPEGGAFVATDAGRAVGFGHARGDRITTLYILASHHRRGLGRRLLRCLLDHLDARGIAQARFEVLAGNTGAMRFYAAEGARAVGRQPVPDGPLGAAPPVEELLYAIATGPQPLLTLDELRVRAWAEVREPLELQLAPLGRHALAALAARPGERVLDIGCGGGETAVELAHAVAPDGTVVGIDVSAAVLAFAAGGERVRFIHADAQTFAFEPASFDAAFSRFGVMFFADPVAAFRNIRRGLKPGGRLAFVCWRALEENPLDSLPLQAAAPHLPPQPVPDPDGPGPFSFADPDRVRGILESAGFEAIEIAAHDELVGSGSLEAMLAVCTRVGALGKILRENPALRPAALPAVRAALAARGGRLNAATWVVTARVASGR